MTDPIDFSEAQYEAGSAATADAFVSPPSPSLDQEPKASTAPEAVFVPDVAAPTSSRSRAARVGRAFAFGGAAALVSSIVWYAILAIADREFGLLAIGVGVLVGRAVRFGSDDLGGRGYQALAVFLTWMGITLGYAPLVAAGAGSELPRVAAWIFGVILAPFTPWLALSESAGDGILGLVIIGIGLWEAFRVNAPNPGRLVA